MQSRRWSSALLSSAEGRAAIAKVTAGAASGITVTGPAAGGVVAALATGRKASTSGASVALDGIHPGLDVKVTREGGPGGAAVSLNYAPQSQEKHAAPEAKAGPKLVEKPVAKETPHPSPDHKPAAAQKHEAAHQAGKKEELTVHRKAERAEPLHTGSAEVDSVVRSPGREIEPATRREMESRIGFDFGSVRLHTDARAGESAQGLSAQAYTVGSDVVFAPGRYSPQTSEGRHLLAHELTHVVQQTSGTERGVTTGLRVAKPAPRVVQRSWSGRDLPGVGWLLDKIHELPGYDLFSFVIGKDLIEDKDVDRNALTLTEAVLQLLGPIGKAILEKLKKVGKALEAAYQWLVGRIRALGLTGDYFSDLLDRAWDAVSGWHPIRSWERIKEIMQEPLDKLTTLAGEIIDKVEEIIIEAAFAVFGETGRKVWAFFKKAANVIGRIAAHPLQFGENLLKAIGEGFKNFFAHIWDNLKEGVKEWVYQELDLPSDIKMPEDFTLLSMFKLLLQVLGLTWEHRRPQLVEKLEPLGGETVVYFFETAADKGSDVIKQVKERGFSAIKDLIAAQAGDIFSGFVSDIKGWIAKEFIERGLKLIAELSNPAGELIKIVESIIDTVSFVIEKAKRIGELINTVIDALSDIIDGNTDPAAKKVENALKRSIPFLLGFIADQFGLKGIGKSIRELIQKIRKPIDDVIGKVLDVIVKRILPVWEAGKAAFTKRLDAIKDWWTKPAPFDFGDEKHEMRVEGEGDKPEVFVYSTKTSLDAFLKAHGASPKQTSRALQLAKGLKWKSGGVTTSDSKAKSYDNFVALTSLMNGLRSKNPPASKVLDTKPRHTYGAASWAEAYLSTSLPTDGTTASGDKTDPPDPAAWVDLGTRLDEESYVRGHLVHNEFGGHAKWENLMPITNGANQRMYHKVEKQLKDLTGDKKNYHSYHYEVHANYNKHPVPKTGTPKERAKAAEQRLVSLSWTVKDAYFDTDDNQWHTTRKPPLDAGENPLPASVLKDSERATDH